MVKNMQNLGVATTDSLMARKMFSDVDKDNSGGIDIDEFTELLEALSMKMERIAIEEVRF